MSDRLSAALAWLVTGSTEEAEKFCGIPGRTIRDWMKEDSWSAIVDEAKRLKQAELDAKFTKLIHKAVDEAYDRLENGDEVVAKDGTITRKRMSGRDAALVAAVFTDKRAIIRGEPTSISKRSTSKDHLANIKDELEKVGKDADPLESASTQKYTN